jgi:uncharacterized sulfatase
VKAGKRIGEIRLPGFLPDRAEVQSDLADYLHEIEHFDAHLVRMLKVLEEAGELENTIVMVTSDNGLAFPRAKANAYEYGIHVPLAISWPAMIPPGRVVNDVVGFVDLTATLFQLSGVAPPNRTGQLDPPGQSLADLLRSHRSTDRGLAEHPVFVSRERHSSSRPNSLGYPQRAVRTRQFLLIRNLHPERWPAGDPQGYDDDGNLGAMYGALHDIDAGPTLSYLAGRATDPVIGRYLQLAIAKRPKEELYDIVADPDCLKNLIDEPAHKVVRERLVSLLDAEMKRTGDSRLAANPEIWESYERYEGKMRRFPVSP